MARGRLWEGRSSMTLCKYFCNAHPLENKICIHYFLLIEIERYCQLFTQDSISEKYTHISLNAPPNARIRFAQATGCDKGRVWS